MANVDQGPLEVSPSPTVARNDVDVTNEISGPSETQKKTAPPQVNTDELPELAKPPEPPGHTTTQTEPTSTVTRPILIVRNLSKTYHMGRNVHVPALQGVSLSVHPGEFVAVMGPSGSGKSTFMNLIGCLDSPSEGEYWLNGHLVSRLSSDELAAIRNQMIGFVFQGFNLLGRATALKNAALPMIYAGIGKRERERRARKALTLLGLANHLHHKPAELSGGQQQRVAIARALVNGPRLLLADEPTGNLDSLTGLEVMAVLQALNEQGLTIVLVTHDIHIAQYAKRLVQFLDGHLVSDERVREPHSASDEWLAQREAAALENAVQIQEET